MRHKLRNAKKVRALTFVLKKIPQCKQDILTKYFGLTKRI
jgi:hypothetical protein